MDKSAKEDLEEMSGSHFVENFQHRRWPLWPLSKSVRKNVSKQDPVETDFISLGGDKMIITPTAELAPKGI